MVLIYPYLLNKWWFTSQSAACETKEGVFFLLSNEVDVFYDPVFLFFIFYGPRKRGSSATNYRGEEFDSFRLISPQTTRILAI